MCVIFVALEGGVRHRGYQQRGHLRGHLGEGRYCHGGGAEGCLQAPRAIEDVGEDLPVRFN